MRKFGNKSFWIGFVSGILFTFTGFYLAVIYSRRTEIVDVTDVESDVIQTVVRHYRLPGQKPREWTRNIYYEDMDSMTISKWKTMTSKERVEAIRHSFLFNPEVDWDSYTYEEQERMLLENAFVEWY